MNVLILEDEKLASERLKRIIKEIDPAINVACQIDTVRDAVDYLNSNQQNLDLIFCDIHLADGLSFEIFKQTVVDKPIVFTTAYDEYSIDAFQVNSIDYLLKPIKQEEVDRSLKKYGKIYSNPALNLSALQKFISEQPGNVTKRFLVRSGSKLVPKKMNEIGMVYIDNKVVQLQDFPEGKNYLIDFTLDEMINTQLDLALFFRINRKQIINIDAIDSIKPYFNQRLSLALKIPTNIEMIVSREKVNDFKKWFLR